MQEKIIKKKNMHKIHKECIKMQCYCKDMHKNVAFLKKLDVYPGKKQYNDHVACKFVPLIKGSRSKIVTVQPAPFVKPHFALIAAIAAVLLIDRRSAHLIISRRISMRA